MGSLQNVCFSLRREFHQKLTFILTFATSLILIWVTFYLVEHSVKDASTLLLYIVLVNFIPGFATAVWFSQGRLSIGDMAVLALPAGLVLNAITITFAWHLGIPQVLVGLPIAAFVYLSSQKNSSSLPISDLRKLSGISLPLTTLLLCATGLISLLKLATDDGSKYFSFHFAFQGVIVRALEQGWPPPNLLLPGLSLSYNYEAHLWTYGVHVLTGISVESLVARYAPIVLTGGAAAAVMAAGRCLFALSRWPCVLSVASIFWIIGIPTIQGSWFATFIPFTGALLLSPLLAIIAFCITLIFVTGELQTKARYLVLACIAFVQTGSRAMAPMVFVCALAFDGLISWLATGVIHRRNIYDLCSCMAGLCIGLAYFFIPWATLNGLGFAQFTGQPFTYLLEPSQYLLPLPKIFIALGIPSILAALCAFMILALFQGGYFVPTLIAGSQSIDQRSRKAVVLLWGASLAGISGVFLTEAPGYSHFSFLHFTNICLTLIGARGFQLSFFEDKRPMFRSFRKSGLFFCVAFLMAVHAQQFSQAAYDELGRISSPIGPAASCLEEDDSTLMQRLVTANAKAIVMFLPRTSEHFGEFLCKTTWMIVRWPVQTLSSYALMFIPGRVEQSQVRTIDEQKSAMASAVEFSATGRIRVADIKKLRATIDHTKTFYVFAEKSLEPDEPDVLFLVDSGVSFRVWKVPIS